MFRSSSVGEAAGALHNSGRRGPPTGALSGLFLGQREVAGGEVSGPLALQRRLVLGAYLLHLGAARVEAAGRRRVRRTRHVAARYCALLALRERGIRYWDRRQERARVRM